MRPILALAATAVLLAGCGGGGDDDKDPSPLATEQPFMDTSAPQLDDTEYVAALCDGIETYMEAVNNRGEEELREVRATMEANARALHPPEGAEEFQRDYVAYLESAESDPTLLLVTDPPLPQGELRTRLASAEADAGCEIPLFTRGDPASPTPGG